MKKQKKTNDRKNIIVLGVMVLALLGTTWIVNTAEVRTFLAGTFAAKKKETCVQSKVKKPDCGSKKVATWYQGKCKYKCQSAEKDAAYRGGTNPGSVSRRCDANDIPAPDPSSVGWLVCECTKPRMALLPEG